MSKSRKSFYILIPLIACVFAVLLLELAAAGLLFEGESPSATIRPTRSSPIGAPMGAPLETPSSAATTSAGAGGSALTGVACACACACAVAGAAAVVAVVAATAAGDVLPLDAAAEPAA